MKIHTIYESTPDERAIMHQKLTMQYLSEEERTIIRNVYKKILDGESKLKPALADGHVTMPEIIYAIKNKRCIGTPDFDLGSTYLENVIGNVITDIFHGKAINAARRVFGMHAISHKPEKPSRDGNVHQVKKPTV